MSRCIQCCFLLWLQVSQHLEDVKYLNGEILRLKDKVALLERDLAVAHQIKVSQSDFWHRSRKGAMRCCCS